MTANFGNEKTETLLLASEGTLRDIEQELKDERYTTTSLNKKITELEKELREGQSNQVYSFMGVAVLATLIGALMGLFILFCCIERYQRS